LISIKNPPIFCTKLKHGKNETKEKSTLQLNSEGKNTLLGSFIASPPHEQKEKNI
jgi:hypothetical protein